MPEISKFRPLIAAWAALALPACNVSAAAHAASRGQDFARIQRGRYLAVAADCNACHEDPYDGKPFAGGMAIETPFGSVLAPNITPDRDTGIGGWSEAQFEAAVRRGRRPDGKRLYPAMPFPYFVKMSPDDVAAIRAYLATIEPVRHAVKADQLPFPFSVRASMLLWDALYFADAPFAPDPTKSAPWNRGAYLVQGPAHCGACHTPKTALGGDKTASALQGYRIQGWFAPNLTNDRHNGLGDWSEADIVKYLETGHNRFDAASGPMADEVKNSSSLMSPSDLSAMALYLKDQTGRATAAQRIDPKDPRMVAGGAIYDDLCASCHKADGTGVPNLIPDLAASAAVASPEPTTVIRVMLEGANSVATKAEPTGPAMPTFGWQLTDAQIAAVGTYIRNSWTHASPAVTERQVHEARRMLAADRAAVGP
ncbi:MAG TPA: c-type cytochrome [Steroidobacteraceae bacterium]|jgi:mono/diheme cytochrome c family protein|nr:c-type cytochrome [Steroidobacteraceae bacterium]